MDRDARDPSLNEVCQELRQEIQASATELRQEIQGSAAEVRRELREEIHASAAEVRRELREDIHASAAETRRHFDVVAEGMLSKVQLVAEGLVAVDEKIERFHDEVRREFKKVDRRLLRLEAR